MNNILYYECHLTINPVFGKQLEKVTEIAGYYGFKPAKLLMQRRMEDTPERSMNDTFLTAHSQNYDELVKKMKTFIYELQDIGMEIWRYKIEAVVLDSRNDDTLKFLKKK